MKKIYYLLIFTLFFTAANAQVGINTTDPAVTLDVTGKPNTPAELDGVIPPRITGEQLRAKNYTAAQTGAFVFVTTADTAPAGQTINVTSPGYYYFDGNVWVGGLTNNKTRVASKCIKDPFVVGSTNGTLLTVGDYSFEWFIDGPSAYYNNEFRIKKNTNGSTYMISKQLGGSNFQVGSSFTYLQPNAWIKIGDDLNIDAEQMGVILIHTEENHVFKITASGLRRKGDGTDARFCYTVEQMN